MLIKHPCFWLFAPFNRNKRAQIANGQKQVASSKNTHKDLHDRSASSAPLREKHFLEQLEQAHQLTVFTFERYPNRLPREASFLQSVNYKPPPSHDIGDRPFVVRSHLPAWEKPFSSVSDILHSNDVFQLFFRQLRIFLPAEIKLRVPSGH